MVVCSSSTSKRSKKSRDGLRHSVKCIRLCLMMARRMIHRL